VQPVGPTPILAALPDDLESDDRVSLFGGDFAQVVARTDFDYDGFFVDTEPGVTLSIDAYLDGYCTNYVYWFGDGAVHSSAPSMPLDLVPSAE
jgi:hypothetical protein